jgi:hypothetical protein
MSLLDVSRTTLSTQSGGSSSSSAELENCWLPDGENRLAEAKNATL